MALLLRVIIFGATGMVGQGVLRECLVDDGVKLVVGGSPTGVRHAKLVEFIHDDFLDYSAIETQLTGFDACFFCLGVSSIGMSEQRYRHLTYDLTLAATTTLARLNPQMVFTYCPEAAPIPPSRARGCGRGSRARPRTICSSCRSGLPKCSGPARSSPCTAPAPTTWVQAIYTVTRPLWSVLRRLSPSLVTSTEQMGRAMIRVAREGYPRKVLEMKDINSL